MGTSSPYEFGRYLGSQCDDHFTAAFSVQVGEPECFSRRHEQDLICVSYDVLASDVPNKHSSVRETDLGVGAIVFGAFR
jgi:hypothetical protein